MNAPVIQNDCQAQTHIITLPWISQQIGPCDWTNGAHAAVHSILAALKYPEGGAHWLEEASRQLSDARRELKGQINS